MRKGDSRMNEYVHLERFPEASMEDDQGFF